MRTEITEIANRKIIKVNSKPTRVNKRYNHQH
jgi:hypothetical protein